MATAAPKLVSREVFVHIIVDGNGKIVKADPDPFWISKGGNQEVVFHCTSSDPNNPHPDFTVEFNKNGTPFHESVFSQAYPCSGLVNRNVKPSNTVIYQYRITVKAANGTVTDSYDPGGGVQE